MSINENEKFKEELQRCIEGGVRTDPATQCAYSVDASIYEVPPLAVVTPKGKHDIIEALTIAGRFNVPVIARGAGTGITGGCLGKGLVLDLSKYMNKILEINIEKEYVICEPGVVQDHLNAALAPYGYRLGPDTSTGNRATLGGMLANNAAGAHSLLYGKMVDHVLAVKIALADGALLQLDEVSDTELARLIKEPSQKGRLYREIDRIRSAYRQDIVDDFPKLPRRVSGYNLDELIKPAPLNLAKLIAGSEGTLGIATAIKMNISKKLQKTGLCIVHVYNMVDGMRAIPQMLAFRPISLEMIDSNILNAAKQSPVVRNSLEWLQGDPQAIFAAEFEGPDLEAKLSAFQEEIEKQKIGYASKIVKSPAEIQQVWDVRKAGLGLLLSKRTYSRAIAFLEDLSIPPDQLASFFTAFNAYLSAHQKNAGIYGHAGSGCMHIRPYINLRKTEDLALMHQMMLDVSSLVLERGGGPSAASTATAWCALG